MFSRLRVFPAVGILLLWGAVVAGESVSTVPVAIGQIQDQVLRAALAEYSPGYDSLGRADQIRAYVNIYKVLNNYQLPPLSPQEQAWTNPPPQTVTTSRTPAGGTGRYDPYADPGYDPFLEGMGILGGPGWRGSRFR